MKGSNFLEESGDNSITQDIYYLSKEGKRVKETEADKILTFYLDASGNVIKISMEMIPSNKWL
jgi:glucan-binding YG repeat protein